MLLLDCTAIVVAKVFSLTIRLFHLGAGATWPGEIALRLRPRILRSFATQPTTIILIAGTNGKTTTGKMIETILRNAGKKVARNESGANLDNGLVSTFLRHASVSGKLTREIFIFEVDEATLSRVVLDIHPKIIILLNLFRDQLDRYGEVDSIAEKWLSTLKQLPSETIVLVNGDDPHLAFLASELPSNVLYFGLNNPDLFLPSIQHATDSIYCPKCGNRLTFGGVYFSHLGKYACGRCGFTHPKLTLESGNVTSPVEGIYNIYNTLAAVLTSKILHVSETEITGGLKRFHPAFGRLEELHVQGKKVKILLSKNPTGFNESLRTVLSSEHHGPLLLVLNDRIPDGRDVSWIWDVDFEVLKKDEQPPSLELKELRRPSRIIVSGDRGYDLGVRLKYAGITHFEVHEELSRAIDSLVHHTKEGETAWILPTYSAMLDVRQILLGRKIL